MVDREDILEIGFEEILALKETLKDQFYGDVSLNR